jgi:hypothetical protein
LFHAALELLQIVENIGFDVFGVNKPVIREELNKGLWPSRAGQPPVEERGTPRPSPEGNRKCWSQKASGRGSRMVPKDQESTALELQVTDLLYFRE